MVFQFQRAYLWARIYSKFEWFMIRCLHIDTWMRARCVRFTWLVIVRYWYLFPWLRDSCMANTICCVFHISVYICIINLQNSQNLHSHNDFTMHLMMRQYHWNSALYKVWRCGYLNLIENSSLLYIYWMYGFVFHKIPSIACNFDWCLELIQYDLYAFIIHALRFKSRSKRQYTSKKKSKMYTTKKENDSIIPSIEKQTCSKLIKTKHRFLHEINLNQRLIDTLKIEKWHFPLSFCIAMP